MTTIKRLILIALIAVTGAACNPNTANPLAPVIDALEPRVAACVTDPTDGWVRCFDQYGNRISEDGPLWDCATMGNLVCGPVEGES